MNFNDSSSNITSLINDYTSSVELNNHLESYEEFMSQILMIFDSIPDNLNSLILSIEDELKQSLNISLSIYKKLRQYINDNNKYTFNDYTEVNNILCFIVIYKTFIYLKKEKLLLKMNQIIL